jgi:histidinol dehydrogenase
MFSVPVYEWNKMPDGLKQKWLVRSGNDIEAVRESVSLIIERVRTEGDAALKWFNNEFDGAPAGMDIKVSEKEFDEAERSLSPGVKQAIGAAVANVRKFHEGQVQKEFRIREISPGVLAGEKTVPIDSVGLYVPRRRGSFPSMLYMLSVPAVLAGVPRIVLMSPPDNRGQGDAATLFTARLTGVHEVYKVGGAHAVAALAYGTGSIKPVVKLSGPGSKFVAAAKELLKGVVDVGMPAGQSESMILADDSADPARLVLDLMIEAEHGSDSQAILVTDSADTARLVAEGIGKILPEVPEPRRGFLTDVFSGYGGILICRDMAEGADIINRFAPEHLQIATRDPWETQSLIRNAGEILLGQNTPFSVANYAVGANAVLPTGGMARTWSSVSVRDFVKHCALVYCSQEGLASLTDTVLSLADYEGFFMHAEALRKRHV